MIKYNYQSVELNAIIICSEVGIFQKNLGSIKDINKDSLDTAQYLFKKMDIHYSAIKDNPKIKNICDWNKCWSYLSFVIQYYKKKHGTT